MNTVVITVTELVGMLKVPIVWPAAIVIVAAGVAWALSEDTLITYPPAGAGALRVTFPTVGVPP